MDRRHQRRFRAHPCQVQSNGRTFSASLLDFSEGGLSVRLPEAELKQGTPTVVILGVAESGPLLVESLVWHSRRLKPRGHETSACVRGLVVANPSEAFSSS